MNQNDERMAQWKMIRLKIAMMNKYTYRGKGEFLYFIFSSLGT